jgi:phospholipase C
MRSTLLWRSAAAVLLLLVGAAGTSRVESQGEPGERQRINHIIVIYMENWSFDGLLGLFPGADGIARAGAALRQVDRNSQPYPTLPQPINNDLNPPVPDNRFPADLPVKPFNLALFVAPDQFTGSPVHRFYQEQYQINGGKMNKFVAWTDSGGLVMSYYDVSKLPLGILARQYTLCDNFFHSAFGGSWLNHIWLASARTPLWPEAPPSTRAQLDGNGIMVQDGAVTPDGYAVNTIYSVSPPYPASVPADERLPLQTVPTIGDRLSERNYSWAWYAGGWNGAIAGHPDPLFQFHHQPFAYFARYADGTPGRAAHLKDESDFWIDLQTGKLPAVSFIKPIGEDDEHPGYATMLRGQQHLAGLAWAVQNSPYWRDSVVVITYDENGGRWDHVAPPAGDRWGPGTRVPAILVSRFARRGHVDHTRYETLSILKMIESRWQLAPLADRDAAANDLMRALRQ